MKSCRNVAEQLVAKPIAKLCLADKALSFKWRYDMIIAVAIVI